MSKKYHVALLGFGSANQEVAKLLHDKRDYLTRSKLQSILRAINMISYNSSSVKLKNYKPIRIFQI